MESEPERLPLGTLTSSDAVGKTNAGTTTTNPRTSSCKSSQNAGRRWNKHEVLRQLAERAKADGTWINDITSLTDGKDYFEKGTENHV